MTVKELREALEDFRDDEPVFISYPSNDYWKSEIARQAQIVDRRNLLPSPYHGDGVMMESGPDHEGVSGLVILTGQREW